MLNYKVVICIFITLKLCNKTVGDLNARKVYIGQRDKRIDLMMRNKSVVLVK